MNYLFQNAWKRVIYHKHVYWLYFLQITLIASLITLASSAYKTIEVNLNEVKDNPISHIMFMEGIEITNENIKKNNKEFSIHDFEKMKKIIGDKEKIAYAKPFNISKLSEIEEKNYHSFIVSNNILKFSTNFDAPILEDKIYAPKEFLEDVHEALVSNMNTFEMDGIHISSVSLDDHTLTINKDIIVSVVDIGTISKNSDKFFFSSNNQSEIKPYYTYDLSKLVLIPQKFQEIYSIDSTSDIGIAVNSEKDIKNVKSFMENIYKGFEFQLKSYYQTFLEESQFIIQILNIILGLLVIMLMIAIIGIIGHLANILVGRQKGIAISYAYGNTMLKMVIEIFTEQFIIVLMACILAIILSVSSQKQITNFYQYRWIIDNNILFLLIPFSAFMCILTINIQCLYIYKLDYVNILSKERGD